MPLALIAALAIAGTAGCTHTHMVHAVPPHLIGHDVEVHTDLAAGDARAVATPGGTVWRNAAGGSARGRHVKEIVDTHHVAGAFEGLGFALAGDIAVGAVYFTAEQQPSDCTQLCGNLPADMGVIALMGTGLIVGPIVGALIGDRDIYKISAAPTTPRVSIVPTRSGATAAVAWKF